VVITILPNTPVQCSHFTDHYAVQVDGGIAEAKQVAMQHGFVFLNEVTLHSYCLCFYCARLSVSSVVPSFLLFVTNVSHVLLIKH